MRARISRRLDLSAGRAFCPAWAGRRTVERRAVGEPQVAGWVLSALARAALGQAQEMARACHRLSNDRCALYGCSLPRRHARPPQAKTGLGSPGAPSWTNSRAF